MQTLFRNPAADFKSWRISKTHQTSKDCESAISQISSAWTVFETFHQSFPYKELIQKGCSALCNNIIQAQVSVVLKHARNLTPNTRDEQHLKMLCQFISWFRASLIGKRSNYVTIIKPDIHLETGSHTQKMFFWNALTRLHGGILWSRDYLDYTPKLRDNRTVSLFNQCHARIISNS